uniref:Uncharacterized protein n=1 Tax=Hordeum vulgare subsp. vulgare TaxID=112509 RepID=A0A8I6XT29_HORVV
MRKLCLVQRQSNRSGFMVVLLLETQHYTIKLHCTVQHGNKKLLVHLFILFFSLKSGTKELLGNVS